MRPKNFSSLFMSGPHWQRKKAYFCQKYLIKKKKFFDLRTEKCSSLFMSGYNWQSKKSFVISNQQKLYLAYFCRKKMTKKKSFLNSKLKNVQAYSCVAVTEKERKVL